MSLMLCFRQPDAAGFRTTIASITDLAWESDTGNPLKPGVAAGETKRVEAERQNKTENRVRCASAVRSGLQAGSRVRRDNVIAEHHSQCHHHHRR